MKNNEKKKKKKVLKVVGLVALFLLVFGLSYALFRITLTGKKKTKITTANFGITLTDINGNEEEEGIAVNLDKAVPEEDSEGLKRDGYKFVVTNTGNVPASYELKIDSTGTLSEECIKYNLVEKDYLKKSDGTYYNGGIYNNAYRYSNDAVDEYTADALTLSTLSNDTLDKTTLLPGEKIEYELKLWVKEDATVDEASNKTYEANVVVDGYQAKEYMSGKTGDTSKYTLYKDGTLAITGSGELKSAIDGSNLGTIKFYNNGGATFGIAYQILNEAGVEFNQEDSDEMSTMQNLFTTMVVYRSPLMQINYSNEFSGIPEEVSGMFIEIFGNEENASNVYNTLITKCPGITRVVIDEGITSTEKSLLLTNVVGDYMLTLPSTMTDLDNMYWGEVQYAGYGLIIPEGVTTISEDDYIGRYLRYLDLSNVETIENNAIGMRYIDELTIPNSVTHIDNGGVLAAHDVTINVDNTREYVEANWDSSWLDYSDHNVTVNYLR